MFKADLIQAELANFDVLAFSETWLNQAVDTDTRILNNSRLPEGRTGKPIRTALFERSTRFPS